MGVLDPGTYFSQLNSWAQALPLAYSLAAGMMAAINPCGFLMLPSFAGFYLSDGEATAWASASDRLRRALWLAAVLTGGFVVVFGLTGIVIAAGSRSIIEVFPWSGLAIGIGLAGLGMVLLMPGRHLDVDVAARIRVVRGRSPKAVFFFGLAYGIASLGCTLPIFLVVVGSAVSAGGFLPALVQFLNYALGMGVIVGVVAVSLALFETGIVTRLHAAMPVVQKLGPAFMILAGFYLIYYWYEYGRLLV
ncbi:MAG: cytochrome c biogenesis protein CcdA [Dehalococcoidia bacterium]